MQTENARMFVLPATTIGAAITISGESFQPRHGVRYVSVQSTFLYGAGGTTCKVFLQTSLDNGATWKDIANHAFLLAAAKKFSAVNGITALAPALGVSDGALADDTILSGLIGDSFRVKVITTGTYTGATSIAVSVIVHP